MKQLKPNSQLKNQSAALGRWAEQCAAELLQQQKWQIMQCNYHSRYGEIDLIACRDDTLLMVEVKARGRSSFAAANEVVSKQKQVKLIKTAMVYLQHQPQFEVFVVRFDVICFDFTDKFAKTVQQDFNKLRYDVAWIENAFTLDFESFNLANE